MTQRFDPNIPSTGPATPSIEGSFTGPMVITEHPALGKSNLVVNRNNPFEIQVSWSIFGNLTPVWLTALSVSSPDWVVTAYAESQGPGPEIKLSTVDVPVSSAPLSLNMNYTATLPVPARTLPEEDPSNPNQSGLYKIVVTVFLNSTLGGSGYDMIGYAEGPIIKVEDPT